MSDDQSTLADVKMLTFLGALNFVCWGNLILLLTNKPDSDVDYGFMAPILLAPPFVVLVTVMIPSYFRNSKLSALTPLRRKILYLLGLLGLLPFALLLVALLIITR